MEDNPDSAADAPKEQNRDRFEAAERLFPFVLRAKKLLVGRETLARSKGNLHFILITKDISAGSRIEVLREFANYPVVQAYSTSDLERFFNVRNAKVLGFAKSSLAKSIYAELKECRLNAPSSKTTAAPDEKNASRG
jgi:hypothetical protein